MIYMYLVIMLPDVDAGVDLGGGWVSSHPLFGEAYKFDKGSEYFSVCRNEGQDR